MKRSTVYKPVSILGLTCMLVFFQNCSQGGSSGEGGTGPQTLVSATSMRLEGMTELAVGSNHSCGITLAKTVKCWGLNTSGQLGDGTNTKSLVPVQVKDLTDIVHVDAGNLHTCATKQNGDVFCWGSNTRGQLGNGTFTDSNVPVLVPGLNDVAQIYADTDGVCVRKNDQRFFCWGISLIGRSYQSFPTAGMPTPTEVPSMFGAGSAPKSWTSTGCYVSENDTPQCVGANTYFHLGTETSPSLNTPVDVQGVSQVAKVTEGVHHACALQFDGVIKCWGGNTSGALGEDPTLVKQSATPVTRTDVGLAQDLASNAYTNCAIVSGEVRCWGANGHGQLGSKEFGPQSFKPVTVPGISNAVQVGAGLMSTCALTSDNVINCWGRF